MSVVYAAAIALISACGLYLILSRHLLRTIFGVVLLSGAVNLVIFLAGRLGSTEPPVMQQGESVLSTGAANPLPQALILTAIVIGFSLVAFMAGLALKAHRKLGATTTLELGHAERLGRFDAPAKGVKAAPEEELTSLFEEGEP